MISLREQYALLIQFDIENLEIPLLCPFTKLVYAMPGCGEDYADVAAAGAARLVHYSVVARLPGKLFVTSIEYAEIMVNTESPQRIDVGGK